MNIYVKNVPGKEEKGRSRAERQELAEAVGGTGEPLQGDGESIRQQGKGTVPVCVCERPAVMRTQPTEPLQTERSQSL